MTPIPNESHIGLRAKMIAFCDVALTATVTRADSGGIEAASRRRAIGNTHTQLLN